MAASAQLPGEYAYRVESTVLVTPSIRELWLVPVDRPLPYAAGQYALLCDAAHRLPQRSYSIACAPRADGRFSLLVTRYPDGPVSGWVHGGLAAGDTVAVDGPYGNFTVDPDDAAPLLLLGAGSGLAPLRAIAEDLLGVEPGREVVLFHSARTAADAIDRARFEGWAQEHPRFRYLVTLTRDPAAPLHAHVPDLLQATLAPLDAWHVYVSGPSGFVTACARAARAAGAHAERVHTEEFFADPEPWSGAPPTAARPDAPA